jgi:haloalkane dehalogenase
MLKTRLLIVASILAVAILLAGWITRDGELITPEGTGTVTLDAGEFEAYPLPEYVTEVLTEDYKSYLVEVELGIKVHVLEVGTGYPVYLQHGNPTSGLLYRKVAATLPTERIRVIMPTMVGLGFSSKIPVGEHKLGNHVRWMNSVLDQLELTELVYVGQDWGGPVGMGALAMSPGLLKGAVLMNTAFTAPTEKANLSRAHAAVKSPVIGELIMEVFTTVFDQLHRAQGDSDSMNESVKSLYARPVLDSGNAKAPVALMRMVTDGPDHPSAPAMRVIEAYVDTLDIPAEIVWGNSDPILGRALPVMKRSFPNAPVTETQAGHFLQEEVPEVIAEAIVRVVDHLEIATPTVSE